MFGSSLGGVGDTDAVLLACYGVDCTTPDRGCENATDVDARRDAADERRCADGLLYPGNSFLEKSGWKAGCGAFVPDDVECLVDGYGNEADFQHNGEVYPGLLDVSGECIVSDCTVEDSQGEPQPGYREYMGFGECTIIDRPESKNSDMND